MRATLKRWGRRVAPVALAVVAASATWAMVGTGDNEDVLKIAYSYRDGGYCGLRESGVPEDVVHKGTKILTRTKSGGSYCCGYTFLVAVKAAQARGLLDEIEPYQLKPFQRQWYGSGEKSAEKLLVPALVDLGIGDEVRPADAMPGDFVQLWRAGKVASGHSVIFLRWVRDERDGEIIGVRYRSSQMGTSGVGNQDEYFTSSGRSDATIDPKRFYVARLKR